MKINKIKNLIFLILSAAIMLGFTSCSAADDSSVSIMIASDTHLLADSLEGDEVYVKSILTNDGRVQEYDTQLLKALVDKANKLSPAALCITGDLTFNGEKESHRAVAEILSQVNEGTKVLVIPGNHDCYNLKAYTYKDDDPKHIKSITYDDFKEIYASCGYEDAYSYDTESLSYIWELSDKQWLIMLDTTLSSYNDLNGANIVGGLVKDQTMLWLEENLKYASENGIEVITFSHHNLITHNVLFEKGYTLSNADKVLELFKLYGVKLNFSGHLHIQNIQQQDGIYDIASGSILDYGNRYGLLEINKDSFVFSREMLKPGGEDISEYAFNTFCKKYEKRSPVNSLASELNAYYFDGDYSKIHELIKERPSEVDEIISAGNAYMGEVMNVPDIDQNYLTIPRGA